MCICVCTCACVCVCALLVSKMVVSERCRCSHNVMERYDLLERLEIILSARECPKETRKFPPISLSPIARHFVTWIQNYPLPAITSHRRGSL
uniref:Putative secreted protein n=1 Tax=Anopheles marajoara TaxID=58244 RepID=A0A2M4C9Q1_9DIPT